MFKTFSFLRFPSYFQVDAGLDVLAPCMFVDFCALIAKSIPLCGEEVSASLLSEPRVL